MILDAAEGLTVAAHGLVVGLGPRKPHAPPLAVTLNAEASIVPHISEDVAATRSGACPDWLIVKTVVLFVESN